MNGFDKLFKIQQYINNKNNSLGYKDSQKRESNKNHMKLN